MNLDPPKIDADDRLSDVPDFETLRDNLEDFRRLHQSTLESFEKIRVRMQEVDASDIELAYHELWMTEICELSSSLRKEADKMQELNWRRFFFMIVPRGADGIIALDHRFALGGDFKPVMPSKKKKPKQYMEMMNWIRESQYADIITIEIKWQAMKKLCGELSEKGLPPPPHVKLSPSPKVYTRKIKK